MKTLRLFLSALSILLCTAGSIAQISIGGYNIYYGSVHNHSSVSDGSGTPANAYNYAKNTSHLDFFSLADHSGAIDASEWTAIKAAADQYNQDGVFTALWGFEWTSSSTYGHVAVLNTTDYCTTATPQNTFSALCAWLNSRECVAFFNHPGREDDTGNEFSHFSTTPSDKIVGMELWNKSDPFSMYYYNDGYYTNDGSKGYYDEAITRSWKIGASGSEDNHSANWGNYCNYRLAVLANANTRADIYAAMQARRFYSTLDKNIALSFKINGSEMGSTVDPGSYTMQILATDADNEIFTIVRLVKNGTVINTWNPNSSSPGISQSLTGSPADYFYVIVTEADGNEAISSPIWVSGNNPLPAVSITSPSTGAWYNGPASIGINATAADDGTIAKVEFYQNEIKIGEDLVSPYSFNWTNVAVGTYELTAKATDNLGAQATSSEVTVYVIPQNNVMASAIIATGNDDAEESAAGVMYLTSTDIELVYDTYNSAGNQTVGLRFLNMGIPAGANIQTAYIQFTTDEVTSGACTLTLKGEASDHSAVFAGANFNVSSRPVTGASVSWVPVGWAIAGEAGLNQRTPDITTIIQEIVDLTGYTNASAITAIITGTGTRSAEAFEGSSTQAARLFVTYSTAPLADFTANPTTIDEGSYVQFTDQSTHNPLTWNWSFTGGTPSESTAQNPSILYGTPGVYPVTLIVSNAGGSDTLTRSAYIHVNPTDYCASQSTNYSGEFISKFTLGTFENASTGSNYSDFTGLTISLQSNKRYTVKITPTFSGGKKMEYFKVWIDYNNDMDFDDSGENVISTSKNAEVKLNFTTPANASGTTRLRVAMKRVSYPGSCETFTYGEVEDYTVSFGAKSSAAEIEALSRIENSQPGLKIYPNPAEQLLYFETAGSGSYDVEMYSMQGILVYKSTVEDSRKMLDISMLNPGIYIIKCTGSEGLNTKKVVIY
jgi:PKD repeat protein